MFLKMNVALLFLVIKITHVNWHKFRQYKKCKEKMKITFNPITQRELLLTFRCVPSYIFFYAHTKNVVMFYMFCKILKLNNIFWTLFLYDKYQSSLLVLTLQNNIPLYMYCNSFNLFSVDDNCLHAFQHFRMNNTVMNIFVDATLYAFPVIPLG